MSLAQPRASGKTTMTVGAALWALLYGFRRYVVMVGANKPEAVKLLESVKNSLQNNKDLHDDFPEVCHPIIKLGNSALLARGQLYINELTNIEWKGLSVKLPTIAGSAASGSRVMTAGLFGAIRGKNSDTTEGETIRPDLVIIDDAQTEATAKSQTQIAKAEDVINKSILGLAGPTQEIAVAFLCTVIEEGDLSDRYLNHKLYPQWRGLRYKMVEEFPKNMPLWEEYRELRKSGNGAETDFYKQHLEAMRAGAVVAWEANHTPDEVDALQHAMNKWSDNYDSFMSECQNEPLQADAGAVVVPSKTIRQRLNGLESQTVPQEATTLTGFIDVHDDLLYYAVVGWADDMTGFVIDYGTYPKQRRRMFSKGDKDLITMQRETNAARVNAAIQIGLTTLIKDLLATDYTVDGDGTTTMQFNKILVDSGYVPKVVETAIRLVRSPVVEASKGAGITAKNKEMASWQKKPGRKFGNYWIEDKPAGRSMRTVTYDANQWKCLAHAGFAVGAGSRGGLTLWGHDANEHRMFSEHCNGEISKLVESGGNKVNEWQPKPGQDNHLFDCLVGNLVAASVCGVRPAEEQAIVKTRRKMV